MFYSLVLILIVIIFLTLPLFAQVDKALIIYGNYAHVITEYDLEVQKGLNIIDLEDIASSIQPHTVVFNPLEKDLNIFSYSYLYDRLSIDSMLLMYLGEEVNLITKDQTLYFGILKSYDRNNLILVNQKSNEVNIVRNSEIMSIKLKEIPKNLYISPTLNISLYAQKKGTHPIEVSYIANNISWQANYSAVWNEKQLILNCWVSLNNNSGKDFKDVSLSLLAGDVQKHHDRPMISTVRMASVDAMAASEAHVPEFRGESFHDFHLYPLNKKIDLYDKQTKNIQFFQEKTVEAQAYYEYLSHNDYISSMIKFTNKKQDGLGVALPAGRILTYKFNEGIENLIFVGEDFIKNTTLEEEVFINTGKAFDLIAETIVKDTRRPVRQVLERDLEISIKNQSTDLKDVNVKHRISNNTVVLDSSMDYVRVDANTIEFNVAVKSGSEVKITWTERTEN